MELLPLVIILIIIILILIGYIFYFHINPSKQRERADDRAKAKIASGVPKKDSGTSGAATSQKVAESAVSVSARTRPSGRPGQQKKSEAQDSIRTQEQNAASVAQHPEILLPFVTSCGGGLSAAQAISQDLVQTIGASDLRDGRLSADDKHIRFYYEDGCHSFFDDGGGYRESKFYLLEKLDASGRQTAPEKQEEGVTVLEDPFGLKGLFKRKYHYSYESE